MITGQGAIWSQTSQAANLVRPSPSACLIDIWPAFCSDTQSWAQDAITMSCHSRLLLRLRTKLEATAPHPKRQRSTSQSQSHSQHQLSPSPQIKPFVHASQLLLMIPVAIHWLLTGCGAQSSLDSLQSFHHAYASSLAHPPHLTSSLMLGRQLVLLDLVLVHIPPESSSQTQAVVPHELHVLPWQLSNSCFDFDDFTFPSSLEAAASPTELQ